jgi:hypothetical protein
MIRANYFQLLYTMQFTVKAVFRTYRHLAGSGSREWTEPATGTRKRNRNRNRKSWCRKSFCRSGAGIVTGIVAGRSSRERTEPGTGTGTRMVAGAEAGIPQQQVLEKEENQEQEQE